MIPVILLLLFNWVGRINNRYRVIRAVAILECQPKLDRLSIALLKKRIPLFVLGVIIYMFFY